MHQQWIFTPLPAPSQTRHPSARRSSTVPVSSSAKLKRRVSDRYDVRRDWWCTNNEPSTPLSTPSQIRPSARRQVHNAGALPSWEEESATDMTSGSNDRLTGRFLQCCWSHLNAQWECWSQVENWDLEKTDKFKLFVEACLWHTRAEKIDAVII